MSATPGLPASVADAFLAELDVEFPVTRRVLERVPDDQVRWKPHPRSFSMGNLAQLVARMPGWLAFTMRDTSLDLGSFQGYTDETTAALLAEFDRNVALAREALGRARDEDFVVPWSLTMKGRVLMSLPRLAVMRQNVNHLVHHRAQLTVYLRLVDVPVPSVYGPTADEPWGS
jgi:uncharacterized damage-inducible protein DinB